MPFFSTPHLHIYTLPEKTLSLPSSFPPFPLPLPAPRILKQSTSFQKKGVILAFGPVDRVSQSLCGPVVCQQRKAQNPSKFHSSFVIRFELSKHLDKRINRNPSLQYASMLSSPQTQPQTQPQPQPQDPSTITRTAHLLLQVPEDVAEALKLGEVAHSFEDLDTDTPTLIIGRRRLKGRYEQIGGTDLIFDPEKDNMAGFVASSKRRLTFC